MRISSILVLSTFLICVSSDAGERDAAVQPKRALSMLVEPAELRQKLDDSNLRILDVRSAEDYGQGHVPGAVLVDVGDWRTLATSDGGLHDTKAWAERIRALGINTKSHVVVYGDRLSNTARIWWLLKYVGVEHAALLNGDWVLWKKSNGPSETSVPKIAKTEFRPDFQADRLLEMDALKKSLDSDEIKVVDTRSDTEFSAGRIPGAAHLEWKDLVADGGRLKTKKQLQQLFLAKGVRPSETAVCY